jgi:hypothetical protein
MSPRVSYRCTSCQARLQASIGLLGQARPCPACGEFVVLQPIIPEPVGLVDGLEEIPAPREPQWEECLQG